MSTHDGEARQGCQGRDLTRDAGRNDHVGRIDRGDLAGRIATDDVPTTRLRRVVRDGSNRDEVCPCVCNRLHGSELCRSQRYGRRGAG